MISLTLLLLLPHRLDENRWSRVRESSGSPAASVAPSCGAEKRWLRVS